MKLSGRAENLLLWRYIMRLLSGCVFAVKPHFFNGFFGKIPQFAQIAETISLLTRIHSSFPTNDPPCPMPADWTTAICTALQFAQP